MQSFAARYPNVEAVEIAPIIDGEVSDERHFVITTGDGSRAMIDADTFRSLYQPTSASPAVARQVVERRALKPKRNGRRTLEKQPPHSTDTSRTLDPSGPTALIIAALKKGPLTSAELVQKLDGKCSTQSRSTPRSRRCAQKARSR